MQEINQKIWQIKINKVVNAKSDLYKSGVFIDEFKIIGVNERRICINNSFFSSFEIRKKGEKKQSYHSYIDDISVIIKTKEDYFGNGVFISLYSTKKPTKAIMNKMLKAANKKIDEDFGFLFSGAKDDLKSIVESYKFQ